MILYLATKYDGEVLTVIGISQSIEGAQKIIQTAHESKFSEYYEFDVETMELDKYYPYGGDATHYVSTT